jgi:hypothetical protein
MWGMVGGARRQEILEGTSMGWEVGDELERNDEFEN